MGHVWGWENDQSCAVRPAPPAPSLPADWVAAPACKSPIDASARADDNGRYWGFEDNKSCAYKDASGAPLSPVSVPSVVDG